MVFGVAVVVLYQLQYITASQYVFLEGIALAVQLIMELPTGVFADVFGRKLSMAIGYFLDAIAILMLSFSTTFNELFVMSILYGIGQSFVSGAREAMLYDTVKQAGRENEFTKVSSKLSLAFQITLAVATVIGGYFGIIYMRLPLWMWAAAQAVSGIIALKFIEPKIDTQKFEVKQYLLTIQQGAKELVKNTKIKTMSLYYILVGSISWVCMLVFNNTFMVQLGYNSFELGAVQALIRIFNSLILIRLVSTSKWFDRKTSILFFPVIMILSLTPGMWLTKWIAVPFIAGSMIASTARWVILQKYVNEEFESKHRATANSALSMAIGIIYIAFTFAAGPIMDNYGGTKTVFTLLGLLSMVTILPLGIHLVKNHSR